MKDIVYRLRDVGRGKGKFIGYLQDNEYYMIWRVIISVLRNYFYFVKMNFIVY